MSSTEDLDLHAARARGRRRWPVWPFNVAPALLIPLGLSLSAPDSVSQLLSALSVTLALACSYFSVRIRFNVFGLILLLVSAYLQFFYAKFLIEKMA